MDRSRINLIKSHKEPTRKCDDIMGNLQVRKQRLGSGQALKSGHPKCAIGPAQMNKLAHI